jgi:hypothetical protein
VPPYVLPDCQQGTLSVKNGSGMGTAGLLEIVLAPVHLGKHIRKLAGREHISSPDGFSFKGIFPKLRLSANSTGRNL